MKRAIRRHFMASIKKKIRREVEEINEYYSRPSRWGKDYPERRETRRQAAIRYAHRNDGRYVRTKEARGGNGHICGCDWCLGNWMRATIREKARINDEEKDFISLGCPPDWGYDWRDIWDYDSYDCYNDPETDWWYEYLESQGISRRDVSSWYLDNQKSTMTFAICDVI